MLTVKNARPDTPGYCSYLSTVEFDLVLQDDELIAVFWYGKSDSSAVVAALLLNLDYTRVENKTDAQLRDIVCSNLGKNRYVITDAKGLDYANVLKF
jgi:hypothetical protein